MTALIDQFNKMKEEGKVMDAFTFSFMGNQALVHGSQRVARAAYQLINESYPNAPGRRTTSITGNDHLAAGRSGQGRRACGAAPEGIPQFQVCSHA
ncbi:MAG: hypothetical protein ACLT8E_00470 [Akkermansia sp.]